MKSTFKKLWSWTKLQTLTQSWITRRYQIWILPIPFLAGYNWCFCLMYREDKKHVANLRPRHE